MGDHPGDRNAAWREHIEQAYRSLPNPNTPQYWQALTSQMADGKRLPLEVLVRCWRWWGAKYRRAEQDGIFTIILGRVQKRISAWAKRTALSAAGGLASGINEELEQECYKALWEKLGETGGFWDVNFLHTLTLLEKNVAQQKMEQEGYRVRKGVKQPRRVPVAQIDSFDATLPGASGDAGNRMTLADVTPDSANESAFENVDFLADLESFMRELTPEQRALFYQQVYEQAPQREIADQLGVTDRTVRARWNQLKQMARTYLLGEQPDVADTAPARAPRKDRSHAE